MRTVFAPGRVCLLAGVLLAGGVVALPAAPGRMDASKRASKFSPEEKAVLPGENRSPERNEVLMDRRFGTGEEFAKESAIVGERRSGIAVEEGREKKLAPVPERKNYDVLERKESPWAGKQSRFSTSEDAYRSNVANRFQDKIADASPISRNVKPAVSQRTTFDRINRFVFRKNGDQGVSVTLAGSEDKSRDISGASAPSPGASGGAGKVESVSPAMAPSER